MLIKNAVKIIKKAPKDVRYALGFFTVATLAISLLLLPISKLEKTNMIENAPVEICGLEPYILPTELSVPAVTEPSVSEQSDLLVLSSACEELFGNASYTVRVSFCALILNRLEDDSFPSSVSAVLRSAGLYPKSLSDTVSERTLHAARAAMLGVDPSMGALYMMNHGDSSFEEYKERVTAILPPYAFIK